ncbi:DoxX family protein [Mycobacterium sp. CBMA271]|uniref:DoxX family protein n=1 Tax=unclassified Mycobacteroides TaxID=2618759 RepID=UPI0012DF5F2D|nr:MULTISPECIES: DoxX family protein [unclassified Mycobacteroides]MUM15960.1 phosphoribosylaminoimidazolecarboxamide formyltransferase [Mycobacteroides sp. CBMA 326]MUM22541.1 DoxX family protein [Mycobacteroides sp. CBMA 271]
MASSTTSTVAKLDGATPLVLSLFRIVFGFLFVCHGTSKLFGWPHLAGMPPIESWSLGWWAGAIEFIAGVAILFGAGTRIAAFIASGTMAFAYFTQHQKLGLLPIVNQGEMAAMYCWAFFLLVFTGGGSLSVDAALKKKS